MTLPQKPPADITPAIISRKSSTFSATLYGSKLSKQRTVGTNFPPKFYIRLDRNDFYHGEAVTGYLKLRLRRDFQDF